jgi:tetratricopeptide (TPR) repeat protein
VADNARIDDLRKRLEKEPGSRLFAQLAEELRKSGDLEEAIQVCRDGLQKHANYTSARMTLGRALMDTGDLTGARAEFDAVVKSAPDNILASRLLGECLEGLGDLKGAQARYKATLALAPGEKQLLAHIEAVEARLRLPAGPPASAPVPPQAPPPPPAPPAAPAAAPDAPIPLVAADEPFELESSYESPATRVVGAPEAAGEGPIPVPMSQVVEESFEIEPPHAAPPTAIREQVVAPAPPPLPPPLPTPAVVAQAAQVPPPLPVEVPPPPAPPFEVVPPPIEQAAPPVEAAPPPASPPAEPPPVAPIVFEELPPPPVEFARPPTEVVAPAPEPAELASSTLAELYFNQGHTPKAIEVYRQLLEREPGNERAQARLTEILALERHLQAEERAVTARASAPMDPRAARRAAIERTIARLEAMRAAIRRE